MQQFLVLFREPDGRKGTHTPEEIAQHRRNWNQWSEQMNIGHHLAGGMPLTLAGRIIKGANNPVTEGPHKVGEEIVGGYLLINAASLEEATTLMQTCPIFEFDGYAEIRQLMTPSAPPAASTATASSATPPSQTVTASIPATSSVSPAPSDLAPSATSFQE